jgi:AAA+ ATPase superfamily predicted ATPase
MKLNPFVVNGYYSPEYFCNREPETQTLKNALENQRNITLFSLRRMGKTDLIKHLFYSIGHRKDIHVVYVDIMPATNFTEFSILFSKAVLSAIARTESTIKKILNLFSALRPVISYNEITGNPEISIDIKNIGAEYSLERVFHFIEQNKTYFLIAIDEFQQIVNYSDSNCEEILRSYIQGLPNACFIFAGSRRHLLTDMFNSPGRAFYKSSSAMEIDSISEEAYTGFINNHFNNSGKSITSEALNEVISASQLHTFYTQYLCNRLYGKSHKNIGIMHVHETLNEIISEYDSIFVNFINILTTFQIRLLRAIASEKWVENITSSAFINAHSLGAASSVASAAESLLDKELIIKVNNKYRVNDIFFGYWLIRGKF